MKKKTTFHAALNILLLLILSGISIKEKYLDKILKKFSDKRESQINWRYEYKTDLYNYYEKKGDVVMLGNSITEEVNWNELLNRNNIINRGIGWDTSEGIKNRLSSVFNTEPKLCFIMAGANDIRLGIEESVIVTNIDAITKKLIDHKIKPIVFSILYVSIDFENYKEFNQKVKSINNELQFQCKKNGIEFIDLNKRLLNTNDLLQDQYSYDGIHLTGYGYSKWGVIVNDIIENSLNQSTEDTVSYSE